MGWSSMDAAFEVKREEARPKTFLQPEGLFGIIPPQWKVFLLGHAKYGRKECWDPEKPIRGVPERAMRSDWTWNFLDKYEEYSEEEISRHFTYYTLKELEEIDFQEPVSLPEKVDSRDEFRHCISAEAKKDDKWKRKPKFGSLTVNQIHRGLKAEGSLEIKRNESIEEIKVTRRKKEFYERGFKELLKTVDRLYQNEAFELKHAKHQEISKDDIRLVLGASISEIS